MTRPSDPPFPADLPVVTPPASTPVYDCRVFISGPDAAGLLSGRVVTLPDIQASARSERELLLRLVQEFKRRLVDYRNRGAAVPWIEAPAGPTAGERCRWIPVHL